MATSVRLEPKLDKRLTSLARRTGRSKAFYVRQAIEEHLADLEDIYLAEKRLEDLKAGRSRTYTIEEVERDLGVAACRN